MGSPITALIRLCFDRHQQVARLDLSASMDVDVSDAAGDLGGDRGLHLQGFEREQFLAGRIQNHPVLRTR